MKGLKLNERFLKRWKSKKKKKTKPNPKPKNNNKK